MATTFTNGQESTQKAKITSYERTGEGTKADKITINYTRTDGNNTTQPMTASKLTAAFTAEEKAMLKEAAENKSELTLVKVFEQKEGAEKGYWNLKTLKSASEFVPKASSSNNYRSNKTNGTTSTSRTPYDSAGAKAGGVLHDAVAVSIAQRGKETTVSHIATVARELLALSTQLENEVRNGVSIENSSDKQEKSTTKTTIPKKTQATSVDEFNSLDDLDSLEIEL